MSNLTHIDKLKLEKLLNMRSGYILDYTNESFLIFVKDSVNRDIYHDRYEIYGTSKAKRLRRFWEIENDNVVGKLTLDMLKYWETQKLLNNTSISENERKLYNHCLEIANRLLGKEVDANEPTESVEDFLQKEFDEVSVKKLNLDSIVTQILEERIDEIKRNLQSGACLSAIFMCGSSLEGILLGIASNNPKIFNQCPSSPKDSNGKVKKLPDWTLNNLIDIAHNVGFLGLDVKKYSHTLRDFRNYIHPYEQVSSGFKPDKHTAKISWQVLKAAIDDLSKAVN